MENSRFKFRVWDKKENILIERGSIDIHLGVFSTSNLLDSTRFIIEQCTGLKDKNGKLIYENDIVTDGEDTGHIFWKEDVGAFAVTMFLFQKRPNELEVIGNIHTNPELLADNKIQAKDLDNNKM